MNRFLLVFIVIVAGIVGLGFYQKWFRFGSDESNLTLTVDKNKFNKDEKAAVDDAKDLGHRIKDKVVGPSEKTTDGTVVSVSGDKLTMTDKDGKEQQQTLAAKVIVTCDGKACTSADLKAGMRIRVTTDTAAPHATSRIEALDKEVAFAGNSHEGKAVSIIGDQLVMTNMEGTDKHTYTLVTDVKVTCDGKVCKAVDVKPGMKIRVTTENAESHSATRVEALEKNASFEKGV